LQASLLLLASIILLAEFLLSLLLLLVTLLLTSLLLLASSLYYNRLCCCYLVFSVGGAFFPFVASMSVVAGIPYVVPAAAAVAYLLAVTEPYFCGQPSCWWRPCYTCILVVSGIPIIAASLLVLASMSLLAFLLLPASLSLLAILLLLSTAQCWRPFLLHMHAASLLYVNLLSVLKHKKNTI
jgi:hypothetical protein